MTRINLIPVEELTDQHLMAEYRELPMIAKALEKTLKSKLGYQESKVSSTYILGTERDRLISHAVRIDAALTRIRHGTCYECSNIDREVDDI